jgi:hypothetical protein
MRTNWTRLAAAALATSWLALGASMADAQGAPPRSTPIYTNAEIVSIHAQQRTIVVRNNDGTQQRLDLDDPVAGLADLRAGDRVILTLRGDPARPRVQAIVKSTKTEARAETRPDSAVTAIEQGTDGAVPAIDQATDDEQLRAAQAYSRRVADLAGEASRVDGLWTGFRTNCRVTLSDSAYEGSREWLSLWDSVQVDLSSGYCRDLFNQIVGRGQSVNSAMAAAESEARRVLEPGTIREIQRQYSLEWSGWGRTPPRRLEQWQ